MMGGFRDMVSKGCKINPQKIEVGSRSTTFRFRGWFGVFDTKSEFLGLEFLFCGQSSCFAVIVLVKSVTMFWYFEIEMKFIFCIKLLKHKKFNMVSKGCGWEHYGCSREFVFQQEIAWERQFMLFKVFGCDTLTVNSLNELVT